MTTEPRLDPDELCARLRVLSPPQRLAFSISCSERLYPNYVQFARDHVWGDPAALRDALDLAWRAVLGELPPPAELQFLRARVDAATPDTEDFATPLVSAALDASATAGLVLSLLTSDDDTIILDIVSMAHETIDMHLHSTTSIDANDPASDAQRLQHPLTQAELHRQRADLDQLAAAPWNPTEAQRLRDAWRAPATSSLGLPLAIASASRI